MHPADVVFDVLHNGEVQLPFTSQENSRVDPSMAQVPVMLGIGLRPEEKVVSLLGNPHNWAAAGLGREQRGTKVPPKIQTRLSVCTTSMSVSLRAR